MCVQCVHFILIQFLFDDDDLFIFLPYKNYVCSLCVDFKCKQFYMFTLYRKIECKGFTDYSPQVYKGLRNYALW